MNRWSIRTRILLALVGLTVAAVLITAILGVSSLMATGESAQESTVASLREQAEDFLAQFVSQEAEENNLLFARIRQDARYAADYAQNLFNNPQSFDSYWQAEDSLLTGDQGQHYNGRNDVSSVWVPGSVTLTGDLSSKLELTAYLDFVFPSIVENRSNVEAIYFIGVEDYTRYYPNAQLGLTLPPDYRATEDIFFTVAAPQNNPQKHVIWTPVYDDPAGKGQMTSAVAPVYNHGGDFVGVIGMDVSLRSITSTLENTTSVADGYLFLIDQQARVIALPERGYEDILGRLPDEGEVGTMLADEQHIPADFHAVIDQMVAGQTGFRSVRLEDREFFVAYTTLTETGWSLATIVDSRNMLQAADDLQASVTELTADIVISRMVPAGALIIIAAGITGIWLSNLLVTPIRELAQAALRIGDGDWHMTLPQSGDDELGMVAKSFNAMQKQLQTLFDNLEQRVAARTRDLQIAADVSTQITTILDPDQLLQQIAEKTRTGFNLYHVAIFLFDGQMLRPVAVSGRDDEVMPIKGGSIPLTNIGLIPRAARERRPVVVNDVNDAPDFYDHPALPKTQSEVAIPMVIGDKLIGVLDFEADAKNRFSQEDLRVMNALGKQIGVALENARLFVEAETARQSAVEANAIKSRFLANMSHELRTPLNAVLNFTAFVADGVFGPVNEEQESSLQQAIASGKHLLSLINDILDITKIEAGLMDLFIQKVDLNEIFSSTVSVAKGLVKEKPIELITDIQPDLPATYGDKRRIRQVFLNLLSNAVKFTPSGTLTITASYRENKILAMVKDTGIGIASEDQMLVFESFRQAKHDLAEIVGTGLGLPISKFFVELHGGKIWLESERGVGTTFYVELPILDEDEANRITDEEDLIETKPLFPIPDGNTRPVKVVL